MILGRRLAGRLAGGLARPAAIVAALMMVWGGNAAAQTYSEAPMLAERVAASTLPPVEERLPERPATIDPLSAGAYGGQIEWLAGRARDIRIMNVYGYARLVGYDAELNLVADILESYEVEGGRIFTFHLRPGLRWSDGEPFTTEAFRYEWFDVQQNEDLRPYGPDFRLLVEGELPEVEIIDDYTVRYSWSQPNPRLIPALAGARPLYLYAPGHYLQQYHQAYADPDTLQAAVESAEVQDWTVLHLRRGNLYSATNPELPVLQPWVNTTAPPSERFQFVRNP
ncbi:MAG: ABC transporter substrate-binding protein, partial [Pseudomonadota bacterium]